MSDLAIIEKSQEFEANFFQDYKPEKDVKDIKIDRTYFMIQEEGDGEGDVVPNPETLGDFENMFGEQPEDIPEGGGFDVENHSQEESDTSDERVEYKGRKQRF